jgi:hypothetical protein
MREVYRQAYRTAEHSWNEKQRMKWNKADNINKEGNRINIKPKEQQNRSAVHQTQT